MVDLYKIIISNKAVDSLKEIIEIQGETSIIGAEDTRQAIFKEIKKLRKNPMKKARKAKFDLIGEDYYSILAWNYRIYFRVVDIEIRVLDIIVDKREY